MTPVESTPGQSDLVSEKQYRWRTFLQAVPDGKQTVQGVHSLILAAELTEIKASLF